MSEHGQRRWVGGWGWAALGLMLAGPCLAGRGDVDPAYAGGGRVPGAIAVSDGRALELRYSGTPEVASLTLRDMHGQVVSAWGDAGTSKLPPGFWVNSRNTALVLADGGILIGGEVDSGIPPSNDGQMAVVKLSVAGSLDGSFGDGGLLKRADGDPLAPGQKACWQWVQGLAEASDGSLLVLYGQYPECYELPTRIIVRRFDASGRREIPFATTTGTLLPGTTTDYVSADLLQVVAGGRICIQYVHCYRSDGAVSNVPVTVLPPPSLPLQQGDAHAIGLMADGDVLITDSADPRNLRVLRVKPDGTPVPAFGEGDVFRIQGTDLLPLFPGGPSSPGLVKAFEGKPDRSIYLLGSAPAYPGFPRAGYFLCRLELAPDGSAIWDRGFGAGGVVMLGEEFSMPLTGTATFIEQADGGLLIRAENATFRLLGAGGSSPGMLVLDGNAGAQAGQGTVAQAGQSIRVIVSRVAGSDGAISIDYATADDQAQAGSEYLATSGRLSWADGDRGDREILIPTLSSARRGTLGFTLRLTLPQGGAWPMLELVSLAVQATAAAPSPGPSPAPVPPSNAGNGGGGASGAAGLVLLLLLLGRAAVLRFGHARQSRQVGVGAH